MKVEGLIARAKRYPNTTRDKRALADCLEMAWKFISEVGTTCNCYSHAAREVRAGIERRIRD